MSRYVAFPIADIQQRARRMPLMFEDDYKSCAVAVEHDAYILYASDADRLAAKYKGYAVSEQYEERRNDPNARIHGCCDRADQY